MSHMYETLINNLTTDTRRNSSCEQYIIYLEKIQKPPKNLFWHNIIKQPFLYHSFSNMALNLALITKLDQLKALPYIFVRDGFESLVRFFEIYPGPKQISTTLIIPEIFSPIVPIEWEEQILYYRFHLKSLSCQKKIASTYAIVKGMTYKPFFSFDFFKRQMNIIKENIHIQLVYFYLDFKYINSHGPERELYEQENVFNGLDVLTYICKEFGDKAKFLSWPQVEGLDNFRSGTFVDLNEQMFLLSDDYSSNFLVSNGCSPFLKTERAVGSNEFFYRISPEHGVVISSKPHRQTGSLLYDLNCITRFSEDRNEDIKNKEHRILDLCRKKICDNVWCYD